MNWFDLQRFSKFHRTVVAYILGWLYADGCNSNGVIYLGLEETDKPILEIIAKYLKSNKPLEYKPKKEMKNKEGQ